MKICRLPLLLILGQLIFALNVSAKEPNTQPNILFIFVDDLGWADVGAFGSDLYETPNIDQLAKDGKKYTQAYTAASICSPTRMSILTGQHPARLRVTDWIPGHSHPHEKLQIPDWNTQGLLPSHVTIGEVIQQQGYKTAWLGKWHVRGLPEEIAKNLGDDPRITQPAIYNGFDQGQQNWHLNDGKKKSDPKGVMELTEEAINFIDNNKSQPWFVTISHYSVHTPVKFHKDVAKRYTKKIKQGDYRQTSANYAAMVEDLDDSVGKIYQYLADNKLLKDTLIVFYSDNGGLNNQGKKGPTNNWPLNNGKGTLYEGGIRVPFIATWHGKIVAGTSSDDLITSTDIFPTFAKLAGITDKSLPTELDGIDLSASLLNDAPVKRQTLYWHYPHYHGLSWPSGSIRDGNYKLIEYFQTGKIEVFNIAKDIGETNNIAKQNPKITEKLLAKLKAWRKEVGAQMMTANPNYDPNKARHD